jgi:hypothetical protein
MGLDMYLTRETHIWSENRAKTQLSGPGLEHVKPERVKKVVEEVGYWRKANAVHRWFVEHVQDGKDDCKTYDVNEEDLRLLLQQVNAVLDKTEKPEDALPAQDGFFFGSTDYGEHYTEDLALTKQIIEAVLAEDAPQGYLRYHSSW